MGECYITRRGTKTGGTTEQLGIYPTGNDGRPMGNVTVLSNVVNLSKYSFMENGNVLTVALPENLRGLSDYCFQKCTGLQNISIPNKITTIPQYCFNGCTSLSKVVLSKTLMAINQYAFQNCTNLYDMVIPSEINSLTVQGYAFSGCQLGNETISKLASLCNGTIYSYAFADITSITEVTTSYTTDYYFRECINLKKATILNPLNNGKMGQNVFNGCTNLTTVVLPDNATVIDNNMFYGNAKLSNVNIPASLTMIGSSAFYNTAINNITLPDSLKTINSSAFSDCSKLSAINIPDAVTIIDSNAFYNCSSLATVTVGENAKYTLGQYAFRSSGVTDESVKNILAHTGTTYSHIFDKCNSLVNIEPSVLWTNMFSNCTNLKTVKSSLTTKTLGDNTFYNDASLTSALLYGVFTTIGINIFYNCTSLKTVYLSSSITNATNNSLTSTSSSYYIFQGCTNLEDIQLGQDWNMSLRLNVSNKITVESMVAMFNSLKDLTGETAKTLTLGSVNLAKLTDEQKQIATDKNWTLA